MFVHGNSLLKKCVNGLQMFLFELNFQSFLSINTDANCTGYQIDPLWAVNKNIRYGSGLHTTRWGTQRTEIQACLNSLCICWDMHAGYWYFRDSIEALVFFLRINEDILFQKYNQCHHLQKFQKYQVQYWMFWWNALFRSSSLNAFCHVVFVSILQTQAVRTSIFCAD